MTRVIDQQDTLNSNTTKYHDRTPEFYQKKALEKSKKITQESTTNKTENISKT